MNDGRRPASPITRRHLFFSFAWPLVKLGSERPLHEEDLPCLQAGDTSAHNKKYTNDLWERRRSREEGSLGAALLRDFFATTRFAQLLLVTNHTAKITQAWAMGNLMGTFGADGVAVEGYKWSAVIIVCGIVASITKQQMFFELYRKGMRTRVGLVAVLFDKVLRLSARGASGLDAGRLVNIASNDVERYLLATIHMLYLPFGPVEAVVILAVGCAVVGPVFAVGHAIFIVLVPFQFRLGRKFAELRARVASVTDSRVALLSQAVSGARLMKMACWELEFEERIERLRKMEVEGLKEASRYKSVNESIHYASSAVVAVVIFAVSVAVGDALTSRKVYTTLSLLNILHLSLAKHLPSAVMHLNECRISSKRIQQILELPEHVPNEPTSKIAGAECPLISCSSMSYEWEDGSPALSEISLSFEKGGLCCLTGKVGSGKTTLLQALAGELEARVTRNCTSIAYAAQTPWIMNGSIKDNIIMGRKFEARWYDEVVEACGLKQDLEGFANGDETLVGTRGVQLSGGQRSRIALAAVFYTDSEVLLLDDPLSAVDSTVARSIQQSAIRRLGVEREKCVIVVSHQPRQLLQRGDKLVVLDRGKVVSCEAWVEAAPSTEIPPGEHVSPSPSRAGDVKDERKIWSQAEKRRTGTVERSTWKVYGASIRGSVCLLLLLLFIATQAVLLLTIVYVGEWSEEVPALQSSPFWFGLMLGLAVSLLLLAVTRAIVSFHTLINASNRLHHQMVKSVLRYVGAGVDVDRPHAAH